MTGILNRLGASTSAVYRSSWPFATRDESDANTSRNLSRPSFLVHRAGHLPVLLRFEVRDSTERGTAASPDRSALIRCLACRANALRSLDSSSADEGLSVGNGGDVLVGVTHRLLRACDYRTELLGACRLVRPHPNLLTANAGICRC